MFAEGCCKIDQAPNLCTPFRRGFCGFASNFQMCLDHGYTGFNLLVAVFVVKEHMRNVERIIIFTDRYETTEYPVV